jgi:hypothetical protein
MKAETIAATAAESTHGSLADRIGALDWGAIGSELFELGCARVRALLTADECASLVDLYARDQLFRSTVVMARHGFGRGEYRYFAYPLPALVAALRTALYARLAQIANAWSEALGSDRRYPPHLDEFLARCHESGQVRPTPLLLRYGAGDYNCLHQDLYGEHVFPLQATLLLSETRRDFSGGEFVLVEQRARMQSRAEVIALERGDAVIFAVRDRPVRGKRGHYRVRLRHGVSRLRSGRRYTAGIIFHDAQ